MNNIPFKLNKYGYRDYADLTDENLKDLVKETLLHPDIMNSKDIYNLSNKTITDVRTIRVSGLKIDPINLKFDVDFNKLKPYYINFIRDNDPKRTILKIPFSNMICSEFFWFNRVLSTEFENIDPNTCSYNELMYRYWIKYNLQLTPVIIDSLYNMR